jgi:hypothetical protein
VLHAWQPMSRAFYETQTAARLVEFGPPSHVSKIAKRGAPGALSGHARHTGCLIPRSRVSFPESREGE